MNAQKRRVSQKSLRQGGDHPDKGGDEDGEAETDGWTDRHSWECRSSHSSERTQGAVSYLGDGLNFR